MDNTSSNISDTRRRTMEVSATMLRDILIGYKEADGKVNVSFDDEFTNDARNRGIIQEPRLKNRAKSEEKSKRLKEHLQKDSRNSLTRNSTNIPLEPNTAMTNINHSNCFSSTSRQHLHDSSRIKNSRRYSPRQGSTGSDVSNKSHSEDSVGSEDGSSNSTNLENLGKHHDQIDNSCSSNAGSFQINPSDNAKMNFLPPVLTSSPLIERKKELREKPKANISTKRAPYYVGDTCNNLSNDSNSNEEKLPAVFQYNPHNRKYNPFLSASSLEIPYEEVYAHLSMQMMSNSGNAHIQNFASLPKNTTHSCETDQSLNGEPPLYDESLYRLLPNPELARACPNPMYHPDEGKSYGFPLFHYYNIEERPVEGIAPEVQRFSENSVIPNSQQCHQDYNVGQSIAYHNGSSSFRYENISLPQGTGNDNLNSPMSGGEAISDESEKLNYDTFQKRISAYHPTQMKLNHHRGRNEGELQHFDSGNNLFFYIIVQYEG